MTFERTSDGIFWQLPALAEGTTPKGRSGLSEAEGRVPPIRVTEAKNGPKILSVSEEAIFQCQLANEGRLKHQARFGLIVPVAFPAAPDLPAQPVELFGSPVLPKRHLSDVAAGPPHLHVGETGKHVAVFVDHHGDIACVALDRERLAPEEILEELQVFDGRVDAAGPLFVGHELVDERIQPRAAILRSPMISSPPRSRPMS